MWACWQLFADINARWSSDDDGFPAVSIHHDH
jgi:hypothetical protein